LFRRRGLVLIAEAVPAAADAALGRRLGVVHSMPERLWSPCSGSRACPSDPANRISPAKTDTNKAPAAEKMFFRRETMTLQVKWNGRKYLSSFGNANDLGAKELSVGAART
jgi:hypothetical protein